MAEFDLLITGGTIVDGTRIPRFSGDIAIRGGQIAQVAHPGAIDPLRAERVLDATGKIVAPGVIDPHTHYDAQIFWGSRPSRWCNFGCGRGPSSGGFGGDV